MNKVYLSGEIHSPWRNKIINLSNQSKLNIDFLTPELDHDTSDLIGSRILGDEESSFWTDRKSALINSIKIQSGIKNSSLVIVKFGEKYKQWNASFDAGFAAALGIPIILIAPSEFNHPLKEIMATSKAVCRTEEEAIEILKYTFQ